MHSIRTKITAITVGVMVIAMVIATLLGVVAIRNIGNRDAQQSLLLLCETGQEELDAYFTSVEQSVEMVSTYVEADLDGLSDEQLQQHLDRVDDIFEHLTYRTHGILTYYYRIDPSVSQAVKGFWYVNIDNRGFKEHEPTDITLYDTNDTSALVWYTVPKATGEAVWLPPYITDNLDERVISYNVPVYFDGTFVGVIGIEIDYTTMAQDVDHIKLYENGYAFLNDEQGNLIYHPHIDVTSTTTPPQAPEGILSDQTFYQYEYEGVRKQAAWLPLSNGMRINVTVPVQEINAAWQQWSLQIALILAVLLPVYIFIMMTFVGRITQPLRHLTEAAEKIGEGTYDVDLSYDEQDEIGLLTQTIKEVTTNLRSYIGDLNDLAYVDALTGVRNRMALRHDYEVYQGLEVTVLMLDLNDFKAINDTRGHEEGDRILRETGQVLAEAFGEDHCYRYGGDEFLAIVPNLPEDEMARRLDYLGRHKPTIDGTALVDFSIGYVREKIDDPEALRLLIATADEKMYEIKRDKKRRATFGNRSTRPHMETGEYTPHQMRELLGRLSQGYDIARVVDPEECRVIDILDDGRVSLRDKCYDLWNASQRCLNCSSATACRTGCPQEKLEQFQDDLYLVESNPVTLRLADGSSYDAVVELIDVDRRGELAINDREEENVGSRAAHYLARHDSLTNVLNANAFFELSREAIGRETRLPWVMVLCDIANFSQVTAIFGASRSNEVLVRVATLLRELAEGCDGLCGRLDEGQFALLVPQATYREESPKGIARTMAGILPSELFALSIQFGVYEVNDTSTPVSVMCERARAALDTIRGDATQVIASFSDELMQRTLLAQEVVSGFDQALASGQYRMYLQPIVGRDGMAVGAEALARWHRTDGTVVLPADFVGTLSAAGLIDRLDTYMWELAVRQLGSWKGTSREELAISVNVSARDFYSIDVCNVLTSLVARHGVDAAKLRLEIVEAPLLTSSSKGDAVVARLRQAGFYVTLDSAGDDAIPEELRNIEVDAIKVSLPHLREIRDKDRSQVILKSLIGLAKSLGTDVVVVGIETERQFRTLTDLGCDHFQGFYFSRPAPVEDGLPAERA